MLPGGPADILNGTRERLLDMGYMAKTAKQVHLYSKSDGVTGWEAVESFVVETQAKDIEVSLEKFEGSAHIQHMMNDSDWYWKLVENLWNNVES